MKRKILSIILCLAMLASFLNMFSINVAADASASVWDGSVDVSWYNTTDTVFYLNKPAQLAGLAAIVDGMYNTGATVYGDPSYIQSTAELSSLTGSTSTLTHFGLDTFKNKTIYLSADLDMGGIYDSASGLWSGPNYMPVGGQFPMDATDLTTEAATILNASFNGVFDGRGHTVKNIYCHRYAQTDYSFSQSVGLIGRLGVHDQDQNNATRLADNPTIRNVVVTGYIYARRSVGGIAGKIGHTNKGGIIENCANFATIKGTDDKGVGGIVGAGWNGGYIKNCINAGNVSNPFGNVGGISGSNEVPIINCYNLGTISGPSSSTGAIGHDNGNSPLISNCYWLTGSAPGGYVAGGSSNTVYEKTSDYLKSSEFLAAINGEGRAFVGDTTPNINNGYPILRMQTSDTATVTSVTKAADPTKLSYVAGQTFNAGGLVLWANYSDGTREKITNYTISKTGALATSDNTITISGNYGGVAYSYDFAITVIECILSGIAITTQPTNVLYASGEYFSPTGMIVKASFSDGSTTTLTSSDYTLNPGTDVPLNPAISQIAISYTFSGITATVNLPITVMASAAPVKIYGVYQLYSADDMLYFANRVNTGLKNDANGILLNDIDLSGMNWTPIGKSGTFYYAGVFEGNYKTLTVSINRTVSCSGIFGYLNSATVNNLTVAGSITGSTNTGGIAGYASGASIINNCINNAAISSPSYYTGGIVGNIWTGTTAITGCTNNGSVYNSYSSSSVYIGGISGYNSGSGIISDCTNNGAVTAIYQYVGGILGGNSGSGSITRCNNTGAVTGSTLYVGGILGYSSNNGTGTLSQCINNGIVKGAYHVGGILGYDSSAMSIYQCANKGSVTATSTAATAAYSAGGVVGYLNAASTVDQCYNSGSVTGGVMNVGGLVGYINNAAGKLTNSYNSGSVTSTSTSTTANTGGVAGYCRNASCTVQNCYNSGSINVNNSGSFTAGVIGYAAGKTNISNDYYLNTTASKGLGFSTIDTTVSKTSDELKALAFTLGAFFKTGGLYPILTWQPDEYSVTVNDTISGGVLSVTPSYGVAGTTIRLTVMPDSGKQLTSGSLAYATDGGSSYTLITAVSGVYSFILQTANTRVTALFENITCSVNASVSGGNGTVMADPSTVNFGNSSVITISPADGYHLDALTDNLIDVIGSVLDHKYTVNDITEDHNVVATFAINTYTVRATISGTGAATAVPYIVNSGDSSIIFLDPASGYRLAAITDNGNDVLSSVVDNKYTITGITEDHNIVVTFALIPTGQSQTWKLDSDGNGNPTVMIKSGTQSGSVGVANGTPAVWWSDAAATAGGVTFNSGVWNVQLNTTGWNGDCKVEVGEWTGSAFNSFGSAVFNPVSGLNYIQIADATGTVGGGNYLALQVTGSGTVITDGSSYLVSPDNDPGYPLPELTAGILLALGLGGLGGFVIIRRKRNWRLERA